MDGTVKETEELVRDAENYIPANELKKGDAVEGSDRDMPMVVSEVTGNDKVPVYDTLTGEKSIVLRYLLPKILREKRKDGSNIWTTGYIPLRLKVGKLKCMLHPESPDREKYDEMGFPTCKKSNLQNQHALNQHMRHRHKVEWAAIEEDKKQAERARDREFQEAIIRAAVKGEAPSVNSETPAVATRVRHKK